MPKKTFTKKDKKGREETWEWEENDEVRKALDRLHDTIRNAPYNQDNAK